MTGDPALGRIDVVFPLRHFERKRDIFFVREQVILPAKGVGTSSSFPMGFGVFAIEIFYFTPSARSMADGSIENKNHGNL